MKHLIALLINYLLAAPLTSLISVDLRLTEWTNILTYVWILVAWPAWILLGVAAALLVAAVCWWIDR